MYLIPMKKIAFFLVLLLSLQTQANEAEIKAKLASRLSQVLGDVNQANITKTPIENLYEVILDTQVLYVSKDGKFLIQGDMLDMQTGDNLTQQRQAKLVAGLLNTIPEADKIIFKANNEKYFIHVFTDVDCPYCRKLHKEVPELNRLGVSVKYLASPLAQLHPKALKIMQSIWCAKDRKSAMDRYKKTNKYAKKSCNSDAVLKQLTLSQKLGVRGTPSIFLSDGTNIPGFIPAKRLLANIQKAKQL